MECVESLRVQAFFDGELDAMGAAQIEHHLGTCDECRALLQDLGDVRALIRREGRKVAMPAEGRSQIMRALGQDNQDQPFWRGKTFWVGLLSGISGGSVAAAFVFLLLSASPNKSLLDDLIANHTRSLLSSHLIDVVSTDQHTVKPWFAGRTDVSPVVADFTRQGYRLMGGRADYLDHERAAVVVYQHGAHFIDVFSWTLRGDRLPTDTTRNGYHLAFWTIGNVAYCAVSDTGWSELDGLVQLLRELGERESKE